MSSVYARYPTVSDGHLAYRGSMREPRSPLGRNSIPRRAYGRPDQLAQ